MSGYLRIAHIFRFVDNVDTKKVNSANLFLNHYKYITIFFVKSNDL